MAEGFVLALAGAPASGKTTVARAVAERTAARCVNFGDLIRAEAAGRGEPVDRAELQRLGQGLLDELGPEAFCLAALRCAGASLEDRRVIWDGVRHLRVHAALCALYDLPVRLVYLEPPAEPRRKRFAREAGSQEQVESWEADATEREGSQLADVAELRCTADTTQEAVDETLALLSLAL